jgi:hypothetical protein
MPNSQNAALETAMLLSEKHVRSLNYSIWITPDAVLMMRPQWQVSVHALEQALQSVSANARYIFAPGKNLDRSAEMGKGMESVT